MSYVTSQIDGPAFIVSPGGDVSINSWLASVELKVHAPYIELFGLDRNEYTLNQSGIAGFLVGNGHIQTFSSSGADARSVGISFVYNPKTGQYSNGLLGLLDQVHFEASTSVGDITNISMYASTSAIAYNQMTDNAFDFIVAHKADYIGSTTVLTETTPRVAHTQSTPDAIAAAANAAVGTIRNSDGCWVMASALAAETGSSLPVLSTLCGGGGQANGEWGVAYDGSVQVNANWVKDLRTGDIIDFVTTSGGGHITTVGAGSGQGAMLIDNAVSRLFGQNFNSAHDGNPNDITVLRPHNQAGEFNGVDPSTVVVYRLDTPLVTDTSAVHAHTALAGAIVSLSSLVSATDPFGRPIAQYQIYNHSADDQFTIADHLQSSSSADNAVVVDSLNGVGLTLGSSFTNDSVAVRAFNGRYWGDWTTVGISAPVKGPAIAVTDVTSGSSDTFSMETINNQAPNYLHWQYINASPDTVAIASTAPNAFIVGGSGQKAISVESGQNVISGGTGSAYLTSGNGNDTFFVDLHNQNSIWDTIVNFHQGDAITIWGWLPGINNTSVDSWSGANGAQGATMRLMDGSGKITASVTFAGLSSDQLSNLQRSTGTQSGVSYLYLTNQGV